MVARGGVCGCSRGGMHGCSGGRAWLLPGGMCGCPWGVCMVAPGGACVVAPGGGVRGFFDEIRSMSGRYASYWNAYLLTVYFLPQISGEHFSQWNT